MLGYKSFFKESSAGFVLYVKTTFDILWIWSYSLCCYERTVDTVVLIFSSRWNKQLDNLATHNKNTSSVSTLSSRYSVGHWNVAMFVPQVLGRAATHARIVAGFTPLRSRFALSHSLWFCVWVVSPRVLRFPPVRIIPPLFHMLSYQLVRVIVTPHGKNNGNQRR